MLRDGADIVLIALQKVNSNTKLVQSIINSFVELYYENIFALY